MTSGCYLPTLCRSLVSSPLPKPGLAPRATTRHEQMVVQLQPSQASMRCLKGQSQAAFHAQSWVPVSRASLAMLPLRMSSPRILPRDCAWTLTLLLQARASA